MGRRSTIVRLSGLYSLGEIAHRATGFIFAVVATRLLGIESYGIYALGMVVLTMSARIGMFGLNFYAQKALSGSFGKAEREKLGAILVINGTVTVITAMVLLLGADFMSDRFFDMPRLAGVLRIMGLGIFFHLPLQLILSIYKSRQAGKQFFMLNTLHSIIKFAGLALALALADRLAAVSLTAPISAAVCCVLGMTGLSRLGVKPLVSSFRGNFGEAFRFGGIVWLTTLSYTTVAAVDKIMLGVLSTAEAVGMYAIPFLVANLLNLFQGAVESVMMPTIASMYRENRISEGLRKAFHFANMLSLVITMSCLLGLVVLGQVVFGRVFEIGEQAYWIFCILALKHILLVLPGPAGSFLNMTKHHRLELMNSIIFMALNVTMNLLLIPRYGAFGAAWASAASMLLISSMRVIETWATGFRVLDRSHLLCVCLAAATISVFLIFIRPSGTIWHIAYLVPAEAVLVGGCSFCFDKEDRSRILQLAKSRLSPGATES